MTTDTNSFIEVLTQATPPPKPLALSSAALILVAAALLTTYVLLGLRPNFTFFHVGFWLKTTALGLAALTACLAAASSARPLASMRAGFSGIALLILLFCLWLGWEWSSQPLPEIIALFSLPNFPTCLTYTTLYGAIGIMGMTMLARHYASLDARKTGSLIGACAAACAGLGYSIHCPIDSPTFILVAYGLPALVLSLAGRVLLPRFLRW